MSARIDLIAAALLVAAAGCATGGPAPDRRAAVAPAPAPVPGTAAPAPAPAPAPATPAAPSTAVSPAPPLRPDPREVAVVSVAFGYSSQGQDVYTRADQHAAAAKDCFERAFPLAGRQPFETLYARVVVPNADVDESRAASFQPIWTGTFYPEPGSYPAFEACLRQAVGRVHAPPDVAEVEVFVLVSSRADEGILGHGSQRGPGP